jgi:tRNA1(Val) A37 N6-methylase TrmN6
MQDVKLLAEHNRLYLQTATAIYDNPNAKPFREICSFGKNPVEDPLSKISYIKEPDGKYTAEYRLLLKDYMLHF